MGKYINSPLKLAGSKQRLLDSLIPILEKYRKDCFVEPFVGAMNVSLNFRGCKEYYLADANPDLINTFKSIRDSKEYYINNIKELFMLPASKHYNEIRDAFNQTGVDNTLTRAVYLQYLNKLSFNGLMRYNQSGKFNVPVGDKEFANVPLEQIESCYRFLSENKVHLQNQSFVDTFDVVDRWQQPALIYVDPPYLKSAIQYTAEGFSWKDQVLLRDRAKQSPHTVVLSNSWNEQAEELYSNADEIYYLGARRSISCDSNTRGTAKECIVVYKGENDEL